MDGWMDGRKDPVIGALPSGTAPERRGAQTPPGPDPCGWRRATNTARRGGIEASCVFAIRIRIRLTLGSKKDVRCQTVERKRIKKTKKNWFQKCAFQSTHLSKYLSK